MTKVQGKRILILITILIVSLFAIVTGLLIYQKIKTNEEVNKISEEEEETTNTEDVENVVVQNIQPPFLKNSIAENLDYKPVPSIKIEEDEHLKNSMRMEDSAELVNIYNNISESLISEKRYDEALIYLNNSLKLNVRNNVTAFVLRNICYEELGRDEDLLKGMLIYNYVTASQENLQDIDRLTFAVISKRTTQFAKHFSFSISHIHYSNFF